MKIRILGDTPDVRGKAFEDLMTLVLSKLNYGNSKKRVHSIGMEFDLDATHNDTKKPIICECKARDDPVPTTDIELFLAKIVHEDSDISLMEGMFFSTSGFIGTAAKWYETLPNKQKQRLQLYDAEGIIEILRENGLILPESKHDEVVKKHTSHQMGERYVVNYDSYLYVVHTLRTGGTASHFMILTNEGELVRKQVEEAIVKLDPSLRTLAGIDTIQEKGLLVLLDAKARSISEITEAIGDTEKNILIALDELEESGLVAVLQNGQTPLYNLNNTIDVLTKLVKRFLESDSKYEFMSSHYLELMINENFSKYVEDRFKIKFEQDMVKVLRKAARIFPSVLYQLLLGDNTLYINSYKHSEQLRTPGNKHENLPNLIPYIFMNDIILKVLSDTRTLDTNYLSKKGVKGIFMRNELRIASQFELIFRIETEGMSFFVPAAGPIESGQYVSSTDITLELSLADTLLALERYPEAIEEYELVIREAIERPDILKAAWHNKGLAHKVLKQHSMAKQCFKTALQFDENIIPTLRNLAECHEILGETEEANRVREKLNQLQSH